MTTSKPMPSEAKQPADKQVPPEPKPKRDLSTQAAIIRELSISGALFGIARCPETHPLGAREAVEEYLSDAGDPKDPIERMLIEQLILAHHRVVNLQVRADEAPTLEAAKVLNAAVVRLMGEIRRFAIAIRQYRLPPGQKQFNLIKEQHIQVNPSAEETLSKQSQLNSDDPLARRMHGTHSPATGRKEKLEETAALVG